VRFPASAVVASTLAIAAAVAAPDLGAQSPVPPPEDPRLHEIAASISAERVERDVRRLEAFGTRHTLSDTLSEERGIGAARRWLHREMESISAGCGGCLEVQYISGTVGGEGRIPDPVEIVNVVAIQRGETDPERYVFITGHYDSRATDVMDGEIDAPGANDNASGTAAVLEAARVLSRHRFPATLVYAAVAGEEQGLFGGEIVAEHARERGWQIEAVLNNDIIGNTHGITGLADNTTARVFAPGIRPDATEAEIRQILYRGGELDTPSRQLGRYVVEMARRYVPTLEMQLIYRLDRFGRGSDHTPFFLRGFPAVRLTETHEDYTRQHQDVRVEDGIQYGDLADAMDFDYAGRITAVNAVSLASLAWAPAAPRNVRIAGAVRPSTTLSWDRADDPTIAGYRVYWRSPTAAAWEQSRWAGDVTELTIENVVIDNHFFGVAAVSADGHESLVVYPGMQ
jgi:hypothetical protein